MSDKNRIEISLLGDFSIKYGDRVINEKNDRSRKKWALLKYLIAFREREISQNELIELLWAESDSSNPAGALKTQLHRLRTALAELNLPADKEIIVNYMNGYAFNTSLDCVIDTAEFEKYFKLSTRQGISEEEQLENCRKAIEIYKGDFLHNSADEKWITPINVYYHSVYLRIIHAAIDILYKQGSLSEVADICRQALSIDNYDQRIHYMLIKTLAQAGEQSSAKRHYEYVIDLFYNQEGISPSGEFLELFTDVIKTNEQHETDLNRVRLHLNESGPPKGAFFCEYEFFKHIYRLEVRDAERSQQTIHICLITIVDKEGGTPQPKAISKSAERLQQSIGASLRASDIFSRYNATQYIIMLLSTSDDISEMVMKRITRRYKADYPKSPVKLVYTYGAARIDGS
ncbi:MAG: winged helix-turn-helix domain-containing protein [Oscillospiraceae bacterium]|nr:winged helix-turn-helix domain-containing protein [Oscillospiraceae bacterium]